MAPRKKKFRTKVDLVTTAGVKEVVELVGPEPAVKHLLRMLALGIDAAGAGVTREGIEMARREAMRQLGGLIHEGN